MPDWDADSRRLHANLISVLSGIRDHARARAPVSVELARGWHEDIMDGLQVPELRFVGAFRGEAGLEDVGVGIGEHDGTAPGQVSAELQEFENHLVRAIEYLDGLIPAGQGPDANTLQAVLDVCAFAHAEWIRIHPFANGNGRTGRLWANLVAMRYGLPPFVRLRPRPEGDAYADASE